MTVVYICDYLQLNSMPKWQNGLVCKLCFNKAIIFLMFLSASGLGRHSWGFYSQFQHKVRLWDLVFNLPPSGCADDLRREGA